MKKTTDHPLHIYVAGPLSNVDGRPASPKERIENARTADALGRELYLMGHWPFIPHTMTLWWFDDPHPDFKDYKKIVAEFDIKGWLSLCDAVYFLPGWSDSKGSRMERRAAKRLGIPAIFKLKDVPKLVKE